MVEPMITTASKNNNMDMYTAIDIDKDNYLSKEHYCTHCKRSFTRIRDRIRHEKSVHIRQERFGCSHCEKTFTRRDSKVRHEHQCLRSNPNDNNNNNNNDFTTTFVIKQEIIQQQQQQQQQQQYDHQRILRSPSPPSPLPLLGTSLSLPKPQPNKPLHINGIEDVPIRLPPILIDKKQQQQQGFYDNNNPIDKKHY